jgi:phage N-6-adenine-methyltransferase
MTGDLGSLHSSLSQRQAAHRFDNDRRYRDGDHPTQTWFTPSYVLDEVRIDLGGSIGLDPCTTDNNPVGAEQFYTPTEDGISQPWGSPGWWPSVFVNPPYSKAREPWVRLCIEAGKRGQKVVLLIPAATDTRIWQEAVGTSTAVVFVKGRVKFGVLRPNRRQVAASHPSALIGWNTDLAASTSLGLNMQWISRAA